MASAGINVTGDIREKQRRQQESHKSVRRTASKAGFGVTIGVGIALMFGMASGQVQAPAISVGGSSNCAGADAWVATWVVSATGDSPTDTWRLDAPAGYSGFRSVAETSWLSRCNHSTRRSPVST